MKKSVKTVLLLFSVSAALLGTAGCKKAEKKEETSQVLSFDAADEMMMAYSGEGQEMSAYCYPTTQSDVYRVMKSGELLQVIGKNSEWVCAEANGERFYLLADQVAELSKEAPSPSEESETEGTAKQETEEVKATEPEETEAAGGIEEVSVSLTSDLKYAEFSKINTGQAKLYKNNTAGNKGITVCVNAGHGTKGGGSVKTQCHPDGSPKVTGGTTAAGATTAVAVSSGMTFLDGTAEASVTLKAAVKLRDRLLADGYSVLMIRENEDVQLDNVARSILANRYADCHIALHWDSTESDKGAFYMAVPSNESYRSMEPVASTWQKSERLGACLVDGLKSAGRKIYGEGSMEMDLTQTSFSRVPSIDIELGDKASDYSDGNLDQIAEGLLQGVRAYFGS